jgi:hypothetical protein
MQYIAKSVPQYPMPELVISNLKKWDVVGMPMKAAKVTKLLDPTLELVIPSLNEVAAAKYAFIAEYLMNL